MVINTLLYIAEELIYKEDKEDDKSSSNLFA